MPINFPNSPAINDIYSYGNKSWKWSGSYWASSESLSNIIDYVSSFNGLTGAVHGVTTSVANTFTALNTFNAGISSNGATFGSNVYMTGDLVVTGRIVTSTGVFGATANNITEPVDNMNMDGGEF
jgi:hypothetical protein